jgi:hypothetical protein
MVKCNASPSASVAARVPLAGVSSGVVSEPAAATGASLTAVIVTVKVAVFESTLPSLALNVIVSVPFAFAPGV